MNKKVQCLFKKVKTWQIYVFNLQRILKINKRNLITNIVWILDTGFILKM